MEDSIFLDKSTARGFSKLRDWLSMSNIARLCCCYGENKSKNLIYDEMKDIFYSGFFKDYKKKVNVSIAAKKIKSNVCKIHVLLWGTNQRLSDSINATQHMYTDLKGNLNNIMAHDTKISTEKNEEKLKKTMSSIFVKLGPCIPNFDEKKENYVMWWR